MPLPWHIACLERVRRAVYVLTGANEPRRRGQGTHGLAWAASRCRGIHGGASRGCRPARAAVSPGEILPYS